MSTAKRHTLKHPSVNKKGTQNDPFVQPTRGKPPVVPIDSGADGRKFAQVVPNVVKKPGQHK